MAGLASEVIKEYLVSLGFKVDEKSASAFDNALKKAQVGVKTYVAAMSAAAVGMAKFVSQMYQKDLQLERDAKASKKSIEATRAYTNALKAMGATADQIKKDARLQSLSKELQQLGKEMALPKGSEAIDTIRNLMNEFTKFKYVGTYVLDWINHKFKTLAAGQIKGISDSLKSFRLRIQQNMPKISTGVATAMKFVASAINSVLRIIGAIGKIVDRIPYKVKLIAAAVSAAILLIRAGPLGWIWTALSAVVVLLDDFFTYLDGGEAALGSVWQKCIDTFNEVRDAIGEAVKKVQSFWEESKGENGKTNWVEFGKKLGTWLWDGIKSRFKTLGEDIKKLILGEEEYYALGNASWGDVFDKIWDSIKKQAGDTGEKFKQLILGDNYNQDSSWTDVGKAIWNGIKKGFGSANENLKKLLLGEEDYNSLKQATWGDVAQKIWDNISSGFKSVTISIDEFLQPLKDKITGDTGSDWKAVGQAIWLDIKNGLSLAADTIKGWGAFVTGKIKTWITGDETASWSDVGNTIWNKIITALKSASTTLQQNGEETGGVFGWLESALGSALDIATQIADGTKTAIDNLMTKGTLGELWQNVKEIATALGGAFAALVDAFTGDNVGDGSGFASFVEGIVEIGAALTDTVATVLQWINTVLSKANEWGILDVALKNIAGSLTAIAALKGLDKVAGFVNTLMGLFGGGLAGAGKSIFSKNFPQLFKLFGGKAGQAAAGGGSAAAGVGGAAAGGLLRKIGGAILTGGKAVAGAVGVPLLVVGTVGGMMYANRDSEKILSEKVSDNTQKTAEALLEMKDELGDKFDGFGEAMSELFQGGSEARGFNVEGVTQQRLMQDWKNSNYNDAAFEKMLQTYSKYGLNAEKAADDTSAAADDTSDAAGKLKDSSGEMKKHTVEMRDGVKKSTEAAGQNVTSSVQTTGNSVMSTVAQISQIVSAAMSQLASSAASAASAVSAQYAYTRSHSGLHSGNTTLAYSNGGFVWNQSHVTVGENNAPEAIIPLTKPKRALELLRDTLGYMGISAQSLVNANAVLGSGGGYGANYAPAYAQASYLTQGSTYNTRTNNVQAPVHMTVYGTDAGATARATERILTRRMIHNMKGAIV